MSKKHCNISVFSKRDPIIFEFVVPISYLFFVTLQVCSKQLRCRTVDLKQQKIQCQRVRMHPLLKHQTRPRRSRLTRPLMWPRRGEPRGDLRPNQQESHRRLPKQRSSQHRLICNNGTSASLGTLQEQCLFHALCVLMRLLHADIHCVSGWLGLLGQLGKIYLIHSNSYCGHCG